MNEVSTLRDRLRRDTREAHARLDRHAERLHLATRPGLRAFLSANLLAYRALRPALPDLPVIDRQLDLIAHDLAALGEPVPAPDKVIRIALPLDTLGAEYVICGSSLGSAVMCRDWAASPDPEVLKADAFLTDRALALRWKALSAELRAMQAQGPHAEAALAGARACFGTFEHAFAHTICLEPELT